MNPDMPMSLSEFQRCLGGIMSKLDDMWQLDAKLHQRNTEIQASRQYDDTFKGMSQCSINSLFQLRGHKLAQFRVTIQKMNDTLVDMEQRADDYLKIVKKQNSTSSPVRHNV